MENKALIDQFRNDFNKLGEMMVNNMPDRADHVLGNFSVGLCPELQFIGWEALKHEDIPNNIPENGVYIYFKIDLIKKEVEVHLHGHVYLSREEQDATYLAMTSLKKIAKGRGIKWFRKQKYKDIEDLYKRMSTFYSNVMAAVNDYTGGYPYKQGIGWVDPSKNKHIA